MCVLNGNLQHVQLYLSAQQDQTNDLLCKHKPILSPSYCCCWLVSVDYDRIKAVGPDRAASEWLLRCGAKVRFQGFERFHHDYNGLPTGPLGKYRIQAIDATDSCIMFKGFDYLGQWCTSVCSLWVDLLLSCLRFSWRLSEYLSASFRWFKTCGGDQVSQVHLH